MSFSTMDFGKKKEREEYRKFALENDFDFELVYFPVPVAVLKKRLGIEI